MADSVSRYATLGDLHAALQLATNPTAVTLEEQRWHAERSGARRSRGAAVGYLQHTASEELFDQIARVHNGKAEARRRIEERASKRRKLADLGTAIEKAEATPPADAAARAERAAKRKEYRLAKLQLADADCKDAADRRAIEAAEPELQRLAAEQLEPSAMKFSVSTK